MNMQRLQVKLSLQKATAGNIGRIGLRRMSVRLYGAESVKQTILRVAHNSATSRPLVVAALIVGERRCSE